MMNKKKEFSEDKSKKEGLEKKEKPAVFSILLSGFKHLISSGLVLFSFFPIAKFYYQSYPPPRG